LYWLSSKEMYQRLCVNRSRLKTKYNLIKFKSLFGKEYLIPETIESATIVTKLKRLDLLAVRSYTITKMTVFRYINCNKKYFIVDKINFLCT